VGSVGLTARSYDRAQQFLLEAPYMQVGCLVLDVRLPDLSGLEVQEKLAEKGLDIPVVVITGHADVPVAIRAMKAGAVDFIEKPYSNEMLLDRVRDAIDASQQQGHSKPELERARQLVARLTPREREVMELVCRGRLNKQIASDLGLSHKTIEVHRANLMEKMEVASLAELVRLEVLLEEYATPASGSQV
jgi:FixJ family two-component response regulator